jgi:hypothetical protein
VYITEILSPKWSPCSGFSRDEEVKEAVTTWFQEQSKYFFSRGIKSLQQKWAKCIELLGDYIEK